MCGRFNVRTAPAELKRIFRTAGVPPNVPPRYNIAPTQDVLTVRFNPQDCQRHLTPLHWGLVPSWAKDRTGAAKLINARSETIDSKASFAKAFAKRRCLIPADGFYEWPQKSPKTADSKAPKQPVAIVPTTPPLFAFAGLWEGWRDPARDGEFLRTCTIVTCPANELLAPYHERMPVILDEGDWASWLGETAATPRQLQALLRPAPVERMRVYRVSTRVNSVACDDESLLAPLEA